jgi:YVTN family beta-propeller protein
MNGKWIVASLALAGVLVPQAGSSATPTDPPAPVIVDRFAPGGDTGWDLQAYDTAGNHLYVSRGSHVQVLDGASGKLAGDIEGTDGVHGIAIVADAKKGYTSNGKSNSVTVFDATSFKVLKQIPLNAVKPDTILYDSASKHVLTFNGGSSNMSVIDPANDTVLATVTLPGQPELAAVDGQGHVYVNLEDKSQVAAIDSMQNKLLSTWALGDCEDPSGLALDAVHHRVFSTCQNHKLVVLDTVSGKRVAEVSIGEHPDGAAFDPATGLLYSPNGEGTLTVIREDDPDHFRVLANVPTQKSARTIVLDPTTHRLFLPAAEYGPTPAPTAEQPHPRPSIVPGSFRVLVVR